MKTMQTIGQQSLDFHRRHRGKITIAGKVPIETAEDLSLAYTPGVGEVSSHIAQDPSQVRQYTNIGNTVAIVTDGSAVLGLGNIGPAAALPVMEGKSLLFKTFADVDAFPICLATQDTEEIIKTVINLAPSFGGINLEDISAPRCFEIERRLSQELDIPVFHDDQHGTAIAVLAGLINALKVVGKELADSYIVINGAGAAGMAITTLLYAAGMRRFSLLDSQGLICRHRQDLNDSKRELLTNFPTAQHACASHCPNTTLAEAITGADIFIGVSQANLLSSAMVQTMNPRAIIFAMANPVPEIMPDAATAAGAAVIATGRSDFPNQINNALVFPGMFRGLLDNGITRVTQQIKLDAARALAEMVVKPTAELIVPPVLDPQVAGVVASAVKRSLSRSS